MIMRLSQALEIVYELALQNALRDEDADESDALLAEFDRQQEAFETVNCFRLELDQPQDQK